MLVHIRVLKMILELPFQNKISKNVTQTISFDTVAMPTVSRWEVGSAKGLFPWTDTFQIQFVGLSDDNVIELESYLEDASNIYLYVPPNNSNQDRFRAAQNWSVNRYPVLAPRGLIGCEVNPLNLVQSPHLNTPLIRSQFLNNVTITLEKLNYYAHSI